MDNEPGHGGQRVRRSRGDGDPTATSSHEDRSPDYGGSNGDGTPRTGAYQRHDPGNPLPATVEGAHQEGGPRPSKRKRKTRGRMRIASLNMRGYGPAVNDESASEKWLKINQIVRDNHIAILALQETHLSGERLEVLNRVFASSLTILGSPDPVNQTGARGVAFVLNNRLVRDMAHDFKVVQPGRAIELRLHWKNNLPLTVHNIYAPNTTGENEQFWKTMNEHYATRQDNRPDVLLGDFNVVEDAADRLPMHGDEPRPVKALRNLRTTADLVDGWRRENPTERAFSYLQASSESQSRIDRIYTTRALERKTADWHITEPGIPTDHKLVMMSVANHRTPHLGDGRWTMPASLFTDTAFMNNVKDLGMALQTTLQEPRDRSQTENPQTAYHAFKMAVRKAAHDRAKVKLPKLDRRIARAKLDLKDTLKNPEVLVDGALRRHAALLQDRIAALEVQRFGQRRTRVAAHDWLEGETMSKYWMKINAPPKPDEVIYEMERPVGDDGRRTFANRSDEMAEIAKAFFDSLQAEETGDDIDAEKEAATRETLDATEARLSSGEVEELDEEIDWDEIRAALVDAPTGKSPGLDGIPAELWKACHKRQLADEKRDAPAFNIVATLKHVFNDIEENGVAEGTDFTKGWICPIYKKKDRRQVSNYRPITLLNADYKIMTRVLAARLATVAPSLVHPDQSGFMSGRRIFDNIKLTKMMIDYAETEEVNGVIVALDQEKAYDRINHDYLWRVLNHAGFPARFINTVKALYANAESIVILNGESSSSFKITRGVRQGDPMSCLLFNLAIEPLACMLRKSDLLGIQIPGLRDRLIATLFADDTTVYLSENDDFITLQGILARWCTASRAKFNAEKTEIIPMGSTQFRQDVVSTRRLGPHGQPFPEGARVTADGTAVRTLGAWVGNGIDPAAPWTPIVDTIRRNLLRWGKRNPTMDARKLIVGIEVGGRTQFLTKAQGMPPAVEKELETIVGNFLWGEGKQPLVNKEMLHRTRRDGGINLLDLAARNEAIGLTWVKEYLDLGPTRPRWAFIADLLLARAVTASSRHVDMGARINTFLQTWEVSTHRAAGLQGDLAYMIKAARKYEVRVESNNPAKSLRETLPIWYHFGLMEGRIAFNTASGRCLRDNHGVVTVLECAAVAARTAQGRGHRNAAACRCVACDSDRLARGCENPARCAEMAKKLLLKLRPKWSLDDGPQNDGLSLTKSRKRKNAAARSSGERITFDPSTADGGDIRACVRVFAGLPDPALQPVRRPPKPFAVHQESVEVYTDGSCTTDEGGYRTAGSGLWYGPADHRNRALRVPGEQSNQTAEIFAVIAAADYTPPFAPLHIVSDSQYVIRGLTSHLPQWEQQGWIATQNTTMFQTAAAKLRGRSAPTTFQWVEGHSGDPGNDGADKQAKEGAALRPDTELCDRIMKANSAYLRKGAQLSTMTQKLLYAGVRRRKEAEKGDRPRTRLMVERVCEAFRFSLKADLPGEALWTGLRKNVVGRKPRQFIWKGLHDALRIGRYWEHIPTMEARASCPVCGATETLEHILLECESACPKEVWGLVRALATRKGLALPRLSFGVVMAGHAFTAAGLTPSPPKGFDRLMRIVFTESLHLIWKVRCEHVIDRGGLPEGAHSTREIKTRWYAALNKRLALDVAQTNKSFGRKALDKVVVEQTWAGTVSRGGELLDDNWFATAGVLVGKLAPEYGDVNR